MRGKDFLQRFVRNRIARLGLAFALIALSAWAFLPYLNYRIASSAFVNSELVRVAAPIAGQLSRELPRKGTYIAEASDVPLVETRSRDNRHLLQLTRQHAVAKERAALARDQLAQIAKADKEFSERAQIYREGVIARLGHEREEAKAEQVGCLAEVHQRRDVGARLEQLVKSGTASQIRSAEAIVSIEATAARCAMVTERLLRLQTELVAAQQGVSLRDGANDAPYSVQQQDRLFLRRQELETKMLEETLQAEQIAAELTEERERIDRLSHVDVALPADHVVWSVAASPGSSVSEGQTVLDLASCSRRFVAVELPEREFERITVGAPAFIRLLGSSDWVEGRVRQVRGSAARGDDRLLAALLPRPLPNSITVEVALPDAAQTDLSNYCNIGRLAEVRFKRGTFAFFDGFGGKLRQLAERFMPRAASERAASEHVASY
jgi:HlyD family secretion protein